MCWTTVQGMFFEGKRVTKFRIEPGSVQETLIIPLYGRMLCAELFPKLHRFLARRCDDTVKMRIVRMDFVGDLE